MTRYITAISYQGVKIAKKSLIMQELLANGFVLNVHDEAVKVFDDATDEHVNVYNQTLINNGFKTFLD